MTEPFMSVDSPGRLAVSLSVVNDAAWPDWAKARREDLLAMPHGERPPHMAASLYAIAREGVEIGADGWTALAQAADLAHRFGLTDLGKSGQAAQLVAVARRERGEAGPHPAPADDPVLEARWTDGWVPAPPPPAPEPDAED